MSVTEPMTAAASLSIDDSLIDFFNKPLIPKRGRKVKSALETRDARNSFLESLFWDTRASIPAHGSFPKVLSSE